MQSDQDRAAAMAREAAEAWLQARGYAASPLDIDTLTILLLAARRAGRREGLEAAAKCPGELGHEVRDAIRALAAKEAE